jgi:hypothetical protein
VNDPADQILRDLAREESGQATPPALLHGTDDEYQRRIVDLDGKRQLAVSDEHGESLQVMVLGIVWRLLGGMVCTVV